MGMGAPLVVKRMNRATLQQCRIRKVIFIKGMIAEYMYRGEEKYIFQHVGLLLFASVLPVFFLLCLNTYRSNISQQIRPKKENFFELLMNLLTSWRILKRKKNTFAQYSATYFMHFIMHQVYLQQRKEGKHCNIICLWWWILVSVPWDVQPVLTNQHIFHSQSTAFSPLFFSASSSPFS